MGWAFLVPCSRALLPAQAPTLIYRLTSPKHHSFLPRHGSFLIGDFMFEAKTQHRDR